jgi:hypothetical protein
MLPAYFLKGMKIVIDADVSQVAEFMMRNVDGSRLCRVAHALAELSDLVWKAEDTQPTERRVPFKIERGNDSARNYAVASPLPATTLQD